MREIKFRAWVTKYQPEGEVSHFMLPVSTIYFYNTDDGGKLDIIANSIRWDKNVTMQFTGMKDKNKNEIWENDIVCTEWSDVPLEVIFEDGCFVFDVRQTEHSPDYGSPILAEECEVIGNIYENPELLKE